MKKIRVYHVLAIINSPGLRSAPLILFLLLQLASSAVAQGTGQSLFIPIPTRVCECSDEEMADFQNKVSEALSMVESWYADSVPAIDEEELKKEVLKETGISPDEATKLQNMSHAEQQAYAMKMAQQAMSQATAPQQPADQEKIKQQQARAAQNMVDWATLQALLVPIGSDFSKLEKEAEEWQIKNLKPLYDTLNTLYENEHETMYRRILEREKDYCRQFTPKHLALIKKQIEVLEQACPIMQEVFNRNLPVDKAFFQASAKEIDPVWLYLQAISKSFDYRIHSDPVSDDK